MKKFLYSIVFSLFTLSGCVELDLYPLTDGSSDDWFTNQQEVEMALNALYGQNLWYFECSRYLNTDRWSDDYNQRVYVYDFLAGEVDATWSLAETHYTRLYRMVSRANTIIDGIAKAADSLTEEEITQYTGEACFFRAVAYSYLTFLWGDVPLVTGWISLEDSYQMSRTPKETVLEQIYADFDVAIASLPASYTNLKRITRGMAYAFKARCALWQSDWEICKEAAQGCIDTGQYELESDFATVFLPETKSSKEHIFYIPRSTSLGSVSPSMQNFIPRVAGGTNTAQQSLELFCAFLCTDGKTIDQSDVFDINNPWENRDPRLTATIVEHGGDYLGYTIDPRPWVLTVTDPQGNVITNNDNRTVNQYAAYNTMCNKKGVSEDWLDNYHEGNIVIMRYADVLLMLAEAKCELGEVDDVAREAINRVRARAYGVDYTDTANYPSVTTGDQSEFRTTLRIERRMELAWENRRWFDLIRWKIADKALNKHNVGVDITLLGQVPEGSSTYFFGGLEPPVVDEDGVVDLSGYIGQNCFVQMSQCYFPERQYLFPIPQTEIMICPNMTQNPGY